MTGAVHNNRMVWADACRVIAMFGVILIHTSAPVFYSYRTIGLSDFLVANGLDSIARVSVPLFIMLSGALLLGRDVDENYTSIVRRVAKVGVPLLFWSFIYYAWVNYWGGGELSVFAALAQALSGPVMYHLWFVYMIIGLYIILPILQVVSVKMMSSDKFSCYLLLVWFLVNSLTIYYPVALIGNFVLFGFLKWGGYFLLGFYLSRSRRFRELPVWLSGSIFFLASLVTFLVSWYLNSVSSVPSEVAFEYLSPNVLLASCAAFHLLMKVRLPVIMQRPISYISNLTFPIFFMHLLVIELIKAGLLGFKIDFQAMGAMSGILLLTLLTFLISALITSLYRCVPFSDRVVG